MGLFNTVKVDKALYCSNCGERHAELQTKDEMFGIEVCCETVNCSDVTYFYGYCLACRNYDEWGLKKRVYWGFDDFELTSSPPTTTQPTDKE